MLKTKLTTITDIKYIDGIDGIKKNVNAAAEMKFQVTQIRRKNLLGILEQLKNISAEIQNKLTIEEFNAEKNKVKDSLEEIKNKFTELDTKETSRTAKIIKLSIEAFKETLEEKFNLSNSNIDKRFKEIDTRLSSRINLLSIRIDETNERVINNTNNIHNNGKGIESNTKLITNNANNINNNKEGIESNKEFITNNANEIKYIKNISIEKINKNVDDNLKNTQTSLNNALENYQNLEQRLKLMESHVSKNTQTTTWVLNVVNPVLKVWNNTLEYVSKNLKDMKLTPLEQETLNSSASVNRSTTSTDTYSLVSASSSFPQSEEISYSASNIQQEKSFSSYTMAVNNVPVSAVSN